MSENNEETNLGPDNSARKRYIEAMGIALGVNPSKAKLDAEALVERFEDADRIDYKTPRPLLDPEAAQTIESIGERFLRGSGREKFSFFVGATILSLINDDLGNGNFAELGSWIGHMTNGTGDGIFRELIGQNSE